MLEFISLGIAGFLAVLGFIVGEYGSSLNAKAINSNGGFMPVYRPNLMETSPIHLSFYKKEEVNNFELCDIYFKCGMTKRGWREEYYSKGDKYISVGRRIGHLSLFSLIIFIILLF